MAVHENSLANLQPFKRGYDPRRRVGRGSLGATIAEWMNVLGDENDDGTAKYDEDALKEISQDSKAAPAKRYAAQTMLRAYKDGWHKHLPYAANDLDRIFDRTSGKPRVTVTHEQGPTRTREEIIAQLSALIQRHPQVLSAVAGQLDGVVDTDATEVDCTHESQLG